MNVKVINIPYNYQGILPILYPEYTVTESVAVTSKFITHKQVTSKMQRDILDVQYSDCIIISTQLFDEMWDEEKIIQECVEFARVRFHSRKTKFTPSAESFIEDCKSFIVGAQVLDIEDNKTFDLFDALGSNTFPVKYFSLIDNYPYQQVFAALTTFISKLDKNSANVFYKKKAMLYKDKIDKNLYRAIDNYNSSLKGDGVAECKFIMDLFV